MLADDGSPQIQSGSITQSFFLESASLFKLIEFITGELPRWRDRPERKPATSETVLTSNFCAHMNSASRNSKWDYIQFRTEEPDEVTPGRKIDLIPAPSGCVVWIDGRKHYDFDPLLPIECKRLPTPSGTKRDKMEYLHSRHSSTGGVARFKEGHHGASHKLGAMIGFIQDEAILPWEKKLSHWTNVLVRARKLGWLGTDRIVLSKHDTALQLGVLRSSHARTGGLGFIELRHLWIEMH